MTKQSSIQRIQAGTHHDPFNVLGWHPVGDTADEHWVLRTFMPAAEHVELEGHAMQRLEGTDCFELILDKSSTIKRDKLATHPVLRWQSKAQAAAKQQPAKSQALPNKRNSQQTADKASKPATSKEVKTESKQDWQAFICPYTFTPQIGELDLHLLGEGKHYDAWHILGARLKEVDGIEGCFFAVWAPGVQRVSVIGDFNDWDGRRYPMRSRGDTGIWEIFIPNLQPGHGYKYEILSRNGDISKKADPYGRQMFMRPETVSCIPEPENYSWQDKNWISNREQFDWQHKPVSIYELHVGSWRKHPDDRFYNWRELADSLIPYISDLNYTHLELLPISEHPLDASWGYQVSGYYAPTARFGTPDDFRYFIDQCHQHDIGVLLDWVPAHFPKDEFALARFIGEPLYEYADPRKGEHQDWGTLIFDYGRNEVRNFLVANALYWIEEFHIDGLRVDAVASMLYLDYSREAGEWLPNQYGGRENIEAIAFFHELNSVVHGRFPGVLTIAEESTAWPAVSRPVDIGGLGFSMKWNMGWMNDNLAYIEQDPVHRKYHHNKLTFSQVYTWTENFVLPLSHDEVVHLKHSMLSKMPGDEWQQFANLRLFYAWQYAHPGKKLHFMGDEFGQWQEWSETKELDWNLLSYPNHDSIRRLVSDLNALYKDQPAMHQYDFNPQGFRWIDCNDSDQSVLSLIRAGDDSQNEILIVLNFTPIPRQDYRIGAPKAGQYREILNTDSNHYAGSHCVNDGELNTEDQAWMGFEQSLVLTLPPLAAIFLQAS